MSVPAFTLAGMDVAAVIDGLETSAVEVAEHLMSVSGMCHPPTVHMLHEGMDPQDAAAKWVDANQATWQPWVDAAMAAQNGSPVANASPSGM